MKTVDLKLKTYIDFGVEDDDKDPKFKVDEHVKISKLETLLQKFTPQIGPNKFFD